jgi:hypothetical protein
MRHRRPVILERIVFGSALLLAAIILFFLGRKAIESRPSPQQAVQLGDSKVVPLPPLDTVRGSGTREGVLNLPPLKVAGVGGGRRAKSAEPPAPPKR